MSKPSPDIYYIFIVQNEAASGCMKCNPVAPLEKTTPKTSLSILPA